MSTAEGGLLFGVTGNFGTKTAAETGTLFSLSPNGDHVEYAVLHSFGKPNVGKYGDGIDPTNLRLVGGKTLIGGCFESHGPEYGGNLFKQSILADGDDPYGIYYTFGAPPDVTGPTMPPLPATGAYTGTYFGVAAGHGAYGKGGIYTLTQSDTGSVVETVIYSFGAQPSDGYPGQLSYIVQMNSSGLLVGTAGQGGAYGQGTFYELEPPRRPVMTGPKKS